MLRTGLRTRVLRSPAQRALLVRCASNAPSPPPEADKYPLPDPNHDPQMYYQGYPVYPAVSRQLRKPYGWDDMVERRNFGEPIPESGEVLSMFGPDPIKVPGPFALKVFGTLLTIYAGITLLIYSTVPEKPAVSREYPEGLTREFHGIQENMPPALEQ